MRIGFRYSKAGRCLSILPTRNIIPDMTKTGTGKKELENIVGNKPVVDKLIEKVGRIKLKPGKLENLKQQEQKTIEQVKKMRQKPKKKINFQL